MTADLENNINFEKYGSTLKIKVNHQGQVTDFGFSEILAIVNVRIDTKIGLIACIQPEISKVIGNMCMTLSSKVNCLKYVNYFNIFDIPGLENVGIDTKIMSVWCLQPEIRKIIHIFKVNHQGQVTDSRFPEILDIVNVRIDTRSILQHVGSRSKERSYNECVWPWLPRSTIKVTGFILTFLISLTSKMLESTSRSSLYRVCNQR